MKTELPLAAGTCVVAGQILALGEAPNGVDAVLGFLTGFFVSGAAMISNDYFDLEVDKVNHPQRPLPSRRISIMETVVMTVLFTIAGLVAAALLGVQSLGVAGLIWTVGIIYNWRGKDTGLPGNMMVSFSVAMTFVFGGISVGEIGSGLVLTFGAMAFIFDLAEEIAGGATDLEGDAMRSVRSLARSRGKMFAIRTSCLLLAAFICLTFVPYMTGWLGTSYLVLIVPTDMAVGYFAYGLLKIKTPEEGRRVKRLLYITLVVFVVALIVSRLI